MTVLAIFDAEGRLLGHALSHYVGLFVSLSDTTLEDGAMLRCVDHRTDAPTVFRTDDVGRRDRYVHVVEFIVRVVRLVHNETEVEEVVVHLVQDDPFEEMWSWPGFSRFTGRAP